ncbi:MAG: HAD family phosphatase [Rhodospirillaceae bacterium]|nr:HAD family phosphatase [Rhodospirillaceae bacterium]MBT6510821.1 HAD family phosphatase [Rhodospirillaceae bacterium]MBT7613429.1 HAD family phosphatase [Rhodospirillaceae bacterium]
MTTPPTHVVFDLGGVLIDWNPRHLYRDLIPDEVERERFLEEVVGQPWNRKQDAGRSIAEANAELIARFPQHRALIEAFYGQFDRMMKGAIEGTVAILHELGDTGVPLYALSNWAAETFPIAQRRFDFFDRFDGMLISGREMMRKPETAIFELLCTRFDLEPGATVFIDDHEDNITAAHALGFHTVHFREPDQLRNALVGWGLLPPG